MYLWGKCLLDVDFALFEQLYGELDYTYQATDYTHTLLGLAIG